jgi:hypothetical protein
MAGSEADQRFDVGQPKLFAGALQMRVNRAHTDIQLAGHVASLGSLCEELNALALAVSESAKLDGYLLSENAGSHFGRLKRPDPATIVDALLVRNFERSRLA